MRTLKVLGFLLTYPSLQQIEVLDECREILEAEKWLPAKACAGVNRLIDHMQKTDLLSLQEAYVDLFDRTPSLCLHLFEHIHGESRERGQALVDLLAVYEDAGLIPATEEMPDYLPLFLEYLSLIDPEQARHDLGGVVDIIAMLKERLTNRGSDYAAICEALIACAARKPDPQLLRQAVSKETGAPLTPEETDKIWEEQHAFENAAQTTGQDQGGGCPKAEEMLARVVKE